MWKGTEEERWAVVVVMKRRVVRGRSEGGIVGGVLEVGDVRCEVES